MTGPKYEYRCACGAKGKYMTEALAKAAMGAHWQSKSKHTGAAKGRIFPVRS